jgi:hypothetical protein
VESPTTVAVRFIVPFGATVDVCPLMETEGTVGLEPPPPPPQALRMASKLTARVPSRGRMDFTISPLKTSKFCG